FTATSNSFSASSACALAFSILNFSDFIFFGVLYRDPISKLSANPTLQPLEYISNTGEVVVIGRSKLLPAKADKVGIRSALVIFSETSKSSTAFFAIKRDG